MGFSTGGMEFRTVEEMEEAEGPTAGDAANGWAGSDLDSVGLALEAWLQADDAIASVSTAERELSKHRERTRP